MPLHRQAKAFVDRLTKDFNPDFQTIDAPSLRRLFELPNLPVCASDQVKIMDRYIMGPAGDLRLRIYTPAAGGPLPMALFCFGGGFVVGAPEQSDFICSAWARRANTLVVCPAYRLAPEDKFPAAVEDVSASLQWLARSGSDIGGDPTRITVAGDSAGGNLAAVLAQEAPRLGIALRRQILIYPALDAAASTPSWREMGTGYGFTAEWMAWYWRQYLPNRQAAQDPRASPLRATNLAGLAPATIVTAEYDILRDEAEIYAARLREGGVAVDLKRWPGQIHGFLRLPGQIDDAMALSDEMATVLSAKDG